MEEIPLIENCCHKVTPQISGNLSFGSVPQWLKGCMIRYGPTKSHKHEDESQECYYKNSPGLLEKFEFKNGQVFHTSRCIQAESLQENGEETNRIGTTFIPDPCHVIFNRLSSTFTNHINVDSNVASANISVHLVGRQIYLIEESGSAQKIELDNLGSTMKINIQEQCGLINISTHPQVPFSDPNHIFTIGQKLDVFKRPQYVILEMKWNCEHPGISPWGKALITATVPSRWLTKVSYMHTFAMTENHFVIIEQPLCKFYPEVLLNLTHHSPKSASSLYYPKKNTLFHVVPRDGSGYRRTYSCPALFFMHTINAYENWRGDISVDVCCYGDPKCVKSLYRKGPRNSIADDLEFAKSFYSRPYRFNLIKKLEQVEGRAPAYRELLLDVGVELPRINDNFNTKMYSYFYGIASDMTGPNAGSLVKVNVELGAAQFWQDATLRSFASEPIFVPNPGSIAEDDGIILATLIYGASNKMEQVKNLTTVAILDARKFRILAKVDFHLNSTIPNSSHGWFLPRSQEDDEE